MSLAIEECDGPEPARLFAGLHQRSGSFFLDSGLIREGQAVYSFIGFDPFLTFRATGRHIHLHEAGTDLFLEGDPLAELRRRLAAFRSEAHPELPLVGGAVGYLSYDYGADWEIRTKPGKTQTRSPDIELGFYDGILAYSHAKKRWFLIANPLHRADAASILQRLREAMQNSIAATPQRTVLKDVFNLPQARESREQYLGAVQRIKEYIRNGDVYQVNLAHRFEARWTGTPYELYGRLRERSPAPYAAFLSLGESQIVSCSPECFLRARNGEVETRPIKGTRPRGKTAEEDERLARELLGSEKERAELLMIVDLERNDLGRVCRPGSIRVEDLYRLEKHPTVFHLVATVAGTLRPECDLLDLVRATFPGGSITGAPKIRAMQIIDELETAPRHVYTGAIGYLGFDQGCDLSIAIRTIVVRNGQASYHVGAGIVWDSDPASEYEETLAKGRALCEALSGTEEDR